MSNGYASSAINDPALLKEKGEGASYGGVMADGETPFTGTLWARPKPLVAHETDFGRPECDWDTVYWGIVEHGIRNSCQRTFAPTGTIATTAGMEGYGCEPLFALFYIRTVMQEREQIKLVYPSQLFLKALNKAGITDEDELVQIAERVKENNGSCQGVEGVPLDIQDIFVVASDLSGVEHVRMQAVLQAFVDNSISKLRMWRRSTSRHTSWVARALRSTVREVVSSRCFQHRRRLRPERSRSWMRSTGRSSGFSPFLRRLRTRGCRLGRTVFVPRSARCGRRSLNWSRTTDDRSMFHFLWAAAVTTSTPSQRVSPV